MRKVVKGALCASALSPIILVFTILLYLKVGFTLEVICSSIVFLGVAALGWLMVVGSAKYGESMRVSIKKFESTDLLLIPFFISYSTPALLRAIEVSFNFILVVLFLIFLIGLVTSYVPTHPILRLLGYCFYKCETEDGMVFTLITRRYVRRKEDFGSVVRIGENLFVERI